MKGSNRRRVVAGAAAVAAVVGTGAAVGATQWSPQAENDAILADVAAQLGVEPDELEGAIENALEDRLDEAVAAGRLSRSEADALKERIESGDFPLFGGGGGPGGPGGMHGGGPIGLDAAASYLGLTDEELRTELEDGSTLAEVAGEQGKSVDGLVTALVDVGQGGSRRRGRGRAAHRGAAGRDPRRARGAHHDARERGLPGRARARRIPGRARRASSDGGRRLGHGSGRHERLDEHVRLRCVAACAEKGGPSLHIGAAGRTRAPGVWRTRRTIGAAR